VAIVGPLVEGQPETTILDTQNDSPKPAVSGSVYVLSAVNPVGLTTAYRPLPASIAIPEPRPSPKRIGPAGNS